MSASGRDCGDADGPETRFQSDMFLLTMASSQRDLFGDDWLSFAVRVHWLKARHLAFQARKLRYQRHRHIFLKVLYAIKTHSIILSSADSIIDMINYTCDSGFCTLYMNICVLMCFFRVTWRRRWSVTTCVSVC